MLKYTKSVNMIDLIDDLKSMSTYCLLYSRWDSLWCLLKSIGIGDVTLRNAKKGSPNNIYISLML